MIKTFFQIGFGVGLGVTCRVLLVHLVMAILSAIFKKLQ